MPPAAGELHYPNITACTRKFSAEPPHRLAETCLLTTAPQSRCARAHVELPGSTSKSRAFAHFHGRYLRRNLGKNPLGSVSSSAQQNQTCLCPCASDGEDKEALNFLHLI